VACRGTEPNEWNDIKADANALTDLAESLARLHRGFTREADDIWLFVEELKEQDERAVWFTGHSLRGAMTQLLAGCCRLADIPAWPQQVYPCGSPRVGNVRYVAHNDIAHVRWVNNNDVVTKVPPTWLRHRHRGERMYLDHEARVRLRLSRRQRLKDQRAGCRKGLKQRKIDRLARAVDARS